MCKGLKRAFLDSQEEAKGDSLAVLSAGKKSFNKGYYFLTKRNFRQTMENSIFPRKITRVSC